MPAKDVKAYVKRNKNDAADAEAIQAVRRIALIVVDNTEQDPADKADDDYHQNLHADNDQRPEPAFVRRLPPPRSRWPITPIPGMVSNRWLASFERCCTMIRFSIDPINARSSSGVAVSEQLARAGRWRMMPWPP